MSATNPANHELETLCALLVEGGLSREQKARLSTLLKEDVRARHFYKRYLEVHAMLEWESGTVTDQQPETDLLQDLLRMERESEAELVHDIGQLRGRGNSPWQIGGAMSWAIKNPTVWTAAAILAIAAILAVVFTGNDPTPTHPSSPTAQQHNTPATQSDQATAVATLTNTHHAQWADTPAERALARGSDLHPGTRLTLTAGFAEITTARGAIAILQAPVTVELLDHDNALRLHAGKLVGICEAESSKGFLVRTPHMDVTDLGTRFGVDASQSETTCVHVFDGEVQVASSDSRLGGQPVRLLAGQSVNGEADTTGQLVVMQNDPSQRYVSDWRGLTDAPRTTGGVRYEPTTPTALGENQFESDDIVVFSERKGFALPQQVAVTLKQTDTGRPFAPDQTVPAGTRVDTYLVHFDTPGSDANRGNRKTGTIRFDRPILGIIAEGRAIASTHAFLGMQGVGYVPHNKPLTREALAAGLDSPPGPEKQDHFRISRDGLALTVDLHVSDSMDQIRVLVQTSETEP